MYYSTLGLLCRPRKVDDIDNFDPRMEEEHLNHCRYLLEDDRFARRGYLCTGGRLESEAIGEVIHHVFCKSGMVKLEKHALVPKPLIALAYVLMRHCFESILNPEHGDHREMFKQENYSMWLYRDTVPDGFREFIQDIDWDDVENVQVGVVNQPPVEFRGVYSYIQEAKEAIWSSYPDYEEKS
ncbi:hypothetical protein O0I10_011631 [Lichtheimia ornata]|uniref:Uncharacterized protein n=1 Tax=Lichtheimia ornata TaxID=688661 RepID=A0AAD7USH0_9FUNG|nr:uncharacterized protein O0I10_011631 [Lichtheimia ornata]KAJ8652749.1 hypothetical protein O0I10_011631 [Lichtheimia ornata]